MIQLERVTKIYRTTHGPLRVLDDVTTVIPTDRNVGILGRNGTGKSTLLRLIARAEAPTRGRIRTDCRLSWPMGFSGGFQGSLSGIENIRFVSRIHGVDWRQTVKFVEEYTELGKFMRMPVSTYSSGMRARLNVAMSLAIRFDTYLVDEIPGVGDARFRKRFDDSFQTIKKESSLILVSHDPGSIKKHCDVVMMVSKGKLYLYENIDEALKVYENE